MNQQINHMFCWEDHGELTVDIDPFRKRFLGPVPAKRVCVAGCATSGPTSEAKMGNGVTNVGKTMPFLPSPQSSPFL